MLLSEWSWGRDLLNVVYVCKDETWSGYLGKGREGTLEVVKLTKDVVEWVKEIFLN